jgi:hypothetical protein
MVDWGFDYIEKSFAEMGSVDFVELLFAEKGFVGMVYTGFGIPSKTEK